MAVRTSPEPQVPRPKPETRSLRLGSDGGIEFFSWYFLRLSGLLLVVLALGHFAIMHVLHSILDVDYHFAAQRWAIPFWRAWDWLLLALALLHGFNGLRVVVNEYVRSRWWRTAAQWCVGLATLLFLGLGTYVVVAFQAPGT